MSLLTQNVIIVCGKRFVNFNILTDIILAIALQKELSRMLAIIMWIFHFVIKFKRTLNAFAKICT